MCSTNLVFLQFSDDRVWYYRMHTPNQLDDNVECVYLKYARPEGNSQVTNKAYDMR
jgi:hypothetical protein